MKTASYYSFFNNAFRLLIVISLVALCCLIFSCAGDEDEEPGLQGKYSIDEISGTWNATLALFSSTEADHKGSIEVVEEGGTFTMVIQNNGKFTITIALPGEPNEVITGKLGFDEEWLAVSYDDDPGEYEYMFIELNGARTEMTIRGNGTFDFDDDGIEDPSSINLEMKKK